MKKEKILGAADADAQADSEKQFQSSADGASPPDQVDVKKIRELLNLSQSEFSAYVGISKQALQQWEVHLSEPSRIEQNFLRVIEMEPRAVRRALG